MGLGFSGTEGIHFFLVVYFGLYSFFELSCAALLGFQRLEFLDGFGFWEEARDGVSASSYISSGNPFQANQRTPIVQIRFFFLSLQFSLSSLWEWRVGRRKGEGGERF